MEEIVETKSWWKRNWIWVTATSAILLFVTLIIVFVVGLIGTITTGMKGSVGYKEALLRAQKNEQIIALLGAPIIQEGMPSGNISYTNGLKSISLTIPINGPKGKGVIRVDGEGVGEAWTYEVMNVFVKSNDTVIDLLENALIVEPSIKNDPVPLQ